MSSLSTDLEMRANLATDILFDILLRLPPDKIYSMILVSQRFLGIISSPLFREAYLAKWKPRYTRLGVFICKTKDSGTFKYELRCSPSANFPSMISSVTREMLELRGHSYLDSSNHLILSSHQKTDYYLWDRRAWTPDKLPPPSVEFKSCCTSLITEESSYKVVCVEGLRRTRPSKTLKVDIFSSLTKTWRNTKLACKEPITIDRKGKVIGGVIYWFASSNWWGDKGWKVAVYDTNSKKNQVDLIELPKDCYDVKAMGISPDRCLQFGRSNGKVIEIWKLEKKLLCHYVNC